VLVATLARGSGENVKFQTRIPILKKNLNCTALDVNLDLKALDNWR
jgi:hypothetical protein